MTAAKRTLITGGAGFIGSHLCDRLIARGDEVIILDDFSSGKRDNIAHLDGRITVIEADIGDIGEHLDALQGVSTIFHMAALISGYDSLNESDAYVRTNINGLLRVMEVARDLGGVRICFASSSTVYGNQPEPVMRETTPPNPLTVYALSKLTGEYLLAMYAELYRFSYVCLRLFNVYGPRQAFDHPYANVTCKFSHAAALGLGVRRYGDGEQTRDFVYVTDVADAFMLVEPGATQAIYNVGTGGDASINTLLAHAHRLADAPLEVAQFDDWPNDIRVIRADISRIATEHGFRAQTALGDGLTDTVQWFREQAKS